MLSWTPGPKASEENAKDMGDETLHLKHDSDDGSNCRGNAASLFASFCRHFCGLRTLEAALTILSRKQVSNNLLHVKRSIDQQHRPHLSPSFERARGSSSTLSNLYQMRLENA